MIPKLLPSLLAGSWHSSLPAQPLRDKFSNRVVAHTAVCGREEAARAVAACAAAAESDVPGPFERGEVLQRAASNVELRREALVATMRIEAGLPQADAHNEVTRCVATLRLCAEEARRLCGQVVPMEGAPQQAGRLGFTLRVPLGVVCAITPFNSPLNVVAHKVGPALAAGNAVVLKPSLHTPASANLLAEALLEGGLPPSLLAVLHGGAKLGQALLEAPQIGFYAFTGSTAVGRKIQAHIGLRRSQMELGSIAHVVMDATADVARAVPRIVAAAYRKAGQVCTSVQVLLVHRRRLDETLALLHEQVAALPFGNPAAPDCVVGPLISRAAAQRVERWIGEARAGGAECLCGGLRDGSVVSPALLLNTLPGMKLRDCEVFGPALSVVPFDTFDQALKVVNATPYGLAAGVFTNDMAHALRAARVLRTGSVFINEASSARADQMPFGGTKDSGFGREGPAWAVREMSEERLVTFSA